ncbi:MAG: WecB/TagA/CpsF family glycosyltransferase [bacterium]|nr:WecB/TagA/CpsF family glycosyltransferase [bacterium]
MTPKIPPEHIGLGVTHHLWKDAQTAILECFVSRTQCQVITLTPEMCVRAESDKEFSNIIKNAAIVVADGVGVVWGESKLTGKRVDKIPGIDLASWTIEEVEKIRGRIYLLGSKRDVVEKGADFIGKKYPDLASIGYRDGYFRDDEEALVVNEIASLEPHLLLVGMGSPKQDYFIANNITKLKCNVAIGVGGSFDIWSGTVKRAPTFFRKTGTEWLYRTLAQPTSRIGRIPELWKFTGLVLGKINK